MSIVDRLRETASQVQRQDRVHQGNLKRLLWEAADEIERLHSQAIEKPKPRIRRVEKAPFVLDNIDEEDVDKESA